MSQSDEDVPKKKCHINFTIPALGEPRALIRESADTRTSLERALAAVNDAKMGFVPETFFFAPLESAIVAKAVAEGPFPNRDNWGTRTEIDWGDAEPDEAL